MKLIIAAFPYATIATAQHLGAALPTKPIVILAGISAFATAYLILRFLYNLFFPDQE